MGKDLAEAFPQARAVYEVVDEALGVALSKLMWEGPEDELTRTHNAQPAILTHTLAVWSVLQHALAPTAGAGHSLGEYSAYVTAGALRLTDAARLVRRRGELMFQAGQARPGTMAALLGLDAAAVAHLCVAASTEGEVVVAANLNAPDQCVISGDPGAVQRAGSAAREAGAKRVLPLKVSGAFHSPLMEPAAAGLRSELDRVALENPGFPVIANASAAPVRAAAEARRLLGEQLTAPVRWVESMQQAVAVAGEGATFVEIGPGTVLRGLLRKIAKGTPAEAVGTVEQVNAFLEQHA
jgi:[acyl-carrier-protein] S-malonyltransferase